MDSLDGFIELAERRIIRGEEIVSRQLMIIERLKHARLSTTEAERTLESMQATLTQFYQDRQALLTSR